MDKFRYKNYSQLGALLMMLSVILGAMAAHSLSGKISEYHISIFEKGVKYQVIHAFTLLLLPLFSKLNQVKNFKWILNMQWIGIVLFSGSLYFLALRPIMGLDHIKWVGAITPFGGMSFIISWFLLFLGIKKLS